MTLISQHDLPEVHELHWPQLPGRLVGRFVAATGAAILVLCRMVAEAHSLLLVAPFQTTPRPGPSRAGTQEDGRDPNW